MFWALVLTCWSFRLCTSPCWTQWRMGIKCNEALLTMATKHHSKKRVRDDHSDMDSDNEMLMNSETNWPRFLIVKLASEDLPLQKLSPFAVQKGFQAVARILKSTKRLRDGSFLVECGKRALAQNLLQTNQFIDRPVKVTIHKTLNSSRGVISCRDLAEMSEVERSGCGWGELSDTEEGGEGDLHQQCLFLTFGSPGSPKRDYSRLSKSEGGLICSQPNASTAASLATWTNIAKLLRNVQIGFLIDCIFCRLAKTTVLGSPPVTWLSRKWCQSGESVQLPS